MARQIAFLNRVGDAPAAIWVMGSDGEEPRQIYSSSGAIVAVAWSPDGTRLAFSMSVGTTFAYEVFLLDAQHLDAPPVQVSQGLPDIGGSISWSPDQQDLLLFAGPAAAREIYRLQVADGTVAQLTHGGNNASPDYSPDGQYIVFNSLRNGGQADLFVMRADGHSTRQLTTFPSLIGSLSGDRRRKIASAAAWSSRGEHAARWCTQQARPDESDTIPTGITMDNIHELAGKILREHGSAALCTVVRSEGSTPRHVGQQDAGHAGRQLRGHRGRRRSGASGVGRGPDGAGGSESRGC